MYLWASLVVHIVEWRSIVLFVVCWLCHGTSFICRDNCIVQYKIDLKYAWIVVALVLHLFCAVYLYFRVQQKLKTLSKAVLWIFNSFLSIPELIAAMRVNFSNSYCMYHNNNQSSVLQEINDTMQIPRRIPRSVFSKIYVLKILCAFFQFFYWMTTGVTKKPF